MNEMHECLTITHPDEGGGFRTEVSALPGCGSQGETVDDAVEMTRDAIEGFIASMREHSETRPVERVALKVTVAA